MSDRRRKAPPQGGVSFPPPPDDLNDWERRSWPFLVAAMHEGLAPSGARRILYENKIVTNPASLINVSLTVEYTAPVRGRPILWGSGKLDRATRAKFADIFHATVRH